METCCGYVYAKPRNPRRAVSIFMGPKHTRSRHDHDARCRALPALYLPLRTIRFRRHRLCCSYFRAPAVKQKRELSPGHVQASRDLSHHSFTLPCASSVLLCIFCTGMSTSFPFALSQLAFRLTLRSGSPLYQCGAQGTIFHFSLQGSHLNTCY